MKTKILTALLVLFITSCTSVKLLNPSQADLDKVKSKYPSYSLTQLNNGKELYEQKCGTCHGLKNPVSYNEAQWIDIVPNMTKMANKKEEKINSNQEDLILKYLITMSLSSNK